MGGAPPHRAELIAAIARPRVMALLAANIPLIILLLGAALRIRHYLANRSLWIDEALLALNLVEMSPGDVLGPLAYHQTAPIGFLLLELTSIRLFGTGEYALRLVPLLAGLLALVLFVRVAGTLLGPAGLVPAATLFAFSGSLVYYGSEVKQYAVDVAVALAIYATVFSARRRVLTARRAVGLVGAGVIGVWLSHPAVFILAASGAGLLLEAWGQKNWRRLVRLLAVCWSWLLSFSTAYFVAQRSIPEATARYLAEVWAFAFPPSSPFSPSTFRWWLEHLIAMFRKPLGLPLPEVGFALSCLALCAAAMRRQWEWWYLAAPVALTLAASGLGKYPFFDRLLLFLLPGAVMLAGRGAELLWEQPGSVARWTAAISSVLLVGEAVSSLPRQMREPNRREEIAPVMRYVRQHYRPGDVLYLYYAAQYAFKYYATERGLAIGDLGAAGAAPPRSAAAGPDRWFAPALISRPPYLVVGAQLRGRWPDIAAELETLRGHDRVWVVFSHVTVFDNMNEQAFYLQQLDTMGTMLASYTQPGAAAYLYDLSPRPSDAGARDPAR